MGPVFYREIVTTPRRPRFFILRAVYVAALFLLMCTAWLVLAGTQVIRNVGDMARFGSILFQILAPLQLTLVLFFSAMSAASAVAQEKDKKTLVLLLLTRMTNSELVLGKLMASLLNIGVMLFAALPLFVMTMLFGGVSLEQILCVYSVTFATGLVAGSLGSTIALWREKTFQTLALTAVTVVVWLGICESVGRGILGSQLGGISCETWAAAGSPLRAILAGARSLPSREPLLAGVGTVANLYVLAAIGMALLLNAIAIRWVRIWNPSRELQQRHDSEPERESIWETKHEIAAEAVLARNEQARQGHVDARLRQSARDDANVRRVWDNPIVWREVCTWAYGRKVILIRITYLMLFAMALIGLYIIHTGELETGDGNASRVIPAATNVLAPFFLVSIVIVNALSVTSITGERDGQALDLLLVTDLSPREFVFGKLAGVFWVCKEMLLAPVALILAHWWGGGVSLENLCYILGGLCIMNVFVTSMGVHYGMTYANSRTAIGLSLGTVFFLFLGIATCIVMMISFSQSFQTQLAPFLAFILGGSLGLYVALGARNPSSAILLAALLVPFMTFYATVSFLLQHPLAVFLVVTTTYGFTTVALLVPALYEFDFAMGRTTTPDEE